jgi:hypothetical protein
MKHGFEHNKWGVAGETYRRSLRCEELDKKGVEVEIFGEGVKKFSFLPPPATRYHGHACDAGSDTGRFCPYRSSLLWVRVSNLDVSVDAL